MRFLLPGTAALALLVLVGAGAAWATAAPAADVVAVESPAPSVATIAAGPEAPAPSAESPPDSIVWLPPVKVYATAMGAFDQPIHIPDGWRIEARIWTTAPSRRVFVALTPGPEVAPRELPATLARRLSAPHPRRPRPPVGFASFADTLGCRFIALNGLVPRLPVRDTRRRAELRAWVLLDSASVAVAGPWVTAFDARGRRSAEFRLEARP